MSNPFKEMEKQVVKHVTEQIHRLAAMWGIKRNDEIEDGEQDDCDHVSGIVKIDGGSGRQIVLAYTDEDKTKPYICSCKHDAFNTVIDFLDTLVLEITISKVLGIDIPMPMAEHFIFEPTIPEIEDIDDCSDAMAVIAKCKASQN